MVNPILKDLPADRPASLSDGQKLQLQMMTDKNLKRVVEPS